MVNGCYFILVIKSILEYKSTFNVVSVGGGGRRAAVLIR